MYPEKTPAVKLIFGMKGVQYIHSKSGFFFILDLTFTHTFLHSVWIEEK